MTDPDRTRPAPPRGVDEPVGGRAPGAAYGTGGSPDHVGRYRIVALLGEGGFGRVYRGIDPGLNREVAIKVPLRVGLTTETREQFLREAHASANIHHPNVCPNYDLGTDADLPFLVMRFVPGGTLAEFLARRKTLLPTRFAAAIARKLALGVAATHEVGVVHRDLKPQNVLWEAARRQVLITDFGLARSSCTNSLRRARRIRGLRRALVSLIFLRACGAFMLQYLSLPNHSEGVTVALSAWAGVLAALIAVVLGVSAYRTLSVNVRAMVEMWRDAKQTGS
jgi:serine/threonine protein kinase